jgi:hypothetical protein
MSILHSKTLNSSKRLQIYYPQHALNLFCGVDTIPELAEGHQLAHAYEPGMKKNFRSFPFQ